MFVECHVSAAMNLINFKGVPMIFIEYEPLSPVEAPKSIAERIANHILSSPNLKNDEATISLREEPQTLCYDLICEEIAQWCKDFLHVLVGKGISKVFLFCEGYPDSQRIIWQA